MPLVRVPTVTGLGREKTGSSLFTSATGQQMPKRETMDQALAALTCLFPPARSPPSQDSEWLSPACESPRLSAANIARISCQSLASSCLLPVSLARVGAPGRFIAYGGTKQRDSVRQAADLYISNFQELVHVLEGQRPVDSRVAVD